MVQFSLHANNNSFKSDEGSDVTVACVEVFRGRFFSGVVTMLPDSTFLATFWCHVRKTPNYHKGGLEKKLDSVPDGPGKELLGSRIL